MSDVLLDDQNLYDIASAIREKLSTGETVTLDMTVSVSGGYNGGAIISITFDGVELFHAIGNSPYNLDYDIKTATVSTAFGDADISVTPPANQYGKLNISIDINDNEFVYASGDISPNGQNTSYGYTFFDTAQYTKPLEPVTTEFLPSEMADAILSIPTGGSGGNNKPVQYDLGDYFGDGAGTVATTLSISLSGHVGQIAILTIMHRSALTMPSDWEIVDKQDNPIVSGEEQQSISIYKKVITSETESYTITQETSKRICANVIYFKDDPQLEHDETIALDDSVSKYHYNIAYKDYYRFCVISDVYAGNQGQPNVNPNVVINTNSTDATIRMVTFVNPSCTDAYAEFDTTHSAGDNASKLNRMFCYKIKASASEAGDSFVPYTSRLYSGWYIATISGTNGGKWTEDVSDPHCIGMSWEVKANHQYIVMAGTNQVSNRWRFGFAHDDLVANPVETVLDNYCNYNSDSEVIRKYTQVITAPYDGYLIGYIGLPSTDNGTISYLLDVTGQDLTGVIS